MDSTRKSVFEPVKKSVYDVLIENLKLAGRQTYIHRYMYMGEHKGDKETEEAFANVIKKINDGYCEERLTGLLLLYPNYFVHIIDGSENGLGHHLMDLFREYDALFGEVRLLCFYHHINQRFFNEWGVRRAKPPILLEKINPASDFEELKRYLCMCVTKVYNLAIELRVVDPEQEELTKIGEIQPYMNQYLPEYNLIQFILHQQDIFSMRCALTYQELLFDTKFILDQVWPVKNDYVPYNVFEVEKNPVPYLPNVPEKKAS